MATAPLRRTLTPSQEAIQYDDTYRCLAESEGSNSIKPRWYHGTPPASELSTSPWATKIDNNTQPGTPNEDDAHRESTYTKRALAVDVNEAAGGRRTPSPTRASFKESDKAASTATSAPVAIPQGRS